MPDIRINKKTVIRILLIIIFGISVFVNDLNRDDTAPTATQNSVSQISAIADDAEPDFTDEQKKETVSRIDLGSLDEKGRCTAAFAVLGNDTLADKKRGSIGMIHPSGWWTVRYDDLISTKYLYNRCHLIAYSLSGVLDDERDLITGTRAMNEAMIPYENEVHDYIEDTGYHVLYRVTPDFHGDNLVASGVKMEAWSVEDKGKGIEFCVYLKNKQSGVIIDYSDGSSKREDGKEADYAKQYK